MRLPWDLATVTIIPRTAPPSSASPLTDQERFRITGTSEVVMRQQEIRNPEEGSGGGYPHPIICTCGAKHPVAFLQLIEPDPESDHPACSVGLIIAILAKGVK